MEESVVRRVPPHSLEAEQSLISSMLMGRDAIRTAAELVSESDFYYHQYGLVFGAMVELNNEGIAVEPVTLQNRLREKNAPEEITSTEFIRELLRPQATSVNAKDYAAIIAEKSLLRRLIKTTEEIQNSCYQDNGHLEELLDESEKKMFSLFQSRNSKEFQSISEVVVDTLEQIVKAYKTKGHITGLATGFAELDYKTSGFQNSDFILIAARPSMGKTALALNIAEYMVLRQNKAVAIFSLEMSKQQLMNRLFAMEASVNSMNLRTGKLKDSDWDKVIESAGLISESKLIIDDTSGITVSEIRSKCRKYKLERGLDIVFIDYLQLMGNGKNNESRQNEVSEISRSLKALARELNVPVVALSQLSRQVEGRTDKRPMLSDLRESGAIEQDADVVMFIYREDYYKKDTELKGVAEIILAKQRNGPIGKVELAWLPDYTKFRSLERQEL